ncbi:MAG: hypothetical protein K6E20_02265 [Acholeplasmatales bacterium]|nr:hypothetical protein [Acholeplasmatales bacterium]
MSKKQSSSSSPSYNKVAGILALIAIFIAGILGLIRFIFELFDGNVNFGRVGSALSLVSNVCLLLAVIMISWQALVSLRLKHKTVWYVIYWIIVVCAILGIVGFSLSI